MSFSDTNSNYKIRKIIEKYKLREHPEGGYFREVYRSEQNLDSPVNKEKRNAVTHIYFLLVKDQISRFHKVLHDEIWNFYEGTPLKIIGFDGERITESIIGKEDYFAIVRGGLFQAAESTGEYTLVGCTVAPGFDFKDFSFLDSNPRALSNLKKQFPRYIYLI